MQAYVRYAAVESTVTRVVPFSRCLSPVRGESAASRPSVSYWLLPLRSGSRRPVCIDYDWPLSQANIF
jgi:hypothetical protein